jgi:hypothetical protein
MTLHRVALRIEGVAPLLLSNGMMADPEYAWAKLKSSLTSKGSKKTDADQIRLNRIMWEGALYLNKDKNLILPGKLLEGMVVKVASSFKKNFKNMVKAGFLIDPNKETNFKLEFLGMEKYNTLEDLYNSGEYIDRRTVLIGKARVVIIRPVFRVWAANFEFMFDDNYLNVQEDVKKLVAYSSVAHLGFVMLGLFALNEQGITGGMLQMLNHGVSTGALFLIVGFIYERRHTRLITDFGGISKQMPIFAVIFMIVTLSSIGLPGTNGFVGEFMILIGSFESSLRWSLP